MALSRWRRYVEAPDGFCIWDELHRHLETVGCKRDIKNGPVTWHGARLKPGGPHTTIAPEQQVETYPECDFPLSHPDPSPR